MAKGEVLSEIAEEEGFEVQSALNLKDLDEGIPGLGLQRQIVTWSFEEDRILGDSRRFDVEVDGKRAYVVVSVSGKSDKDGVVISSELLSQIRPELINKKKAAMIEDKISGTTLEEIANSASTTVRRASSVNLASPLLSGVGNEPTVVGAMSTLPIDVISDYIQGEKGVFIVKVTKREQPVDLENYSSFTKSRALKLRGRTFEIFPVLEAAADIKDNRAKFF